MVAVMQKCKHFATFAENNDAVGKGRCECVSFTLHVCSVCVGVAAATALWGVEWERLRWNERESTLTKLEIWDLYHKWTLHYRRTALMIREWRCCTNVVCYMVFKSYQQSLHWKPQVFTVRLLMGTVCTNTCRWKPTVCAKLLMWLLNMWG